MFKDKKGNCQIMATKGIWPLKLEANVVENRSAGAFYLNMVIHGQGQVQMAMRRMKNEKEKQPDLSQGWLVQLGVWWGESRGWKGETTIFITGLVGSTSRMMMRRIKEKVKMNGKDKWRVRWQKCNLLTKDLLIAILASATINKDQEHNFNCEI